jgi:hypothetical protein
MGSDLHYFIPPIHTLVPFCVHSDDLSIFAFATREDNPAFSLFVNCVVWAIIYAEKKGITKEQSKWMPVMPWVGKEFEWALKDAIHYSGSYDQIYKNISVMLQKKTEVEIS